jgi:SAM-dependent methyltransferase
MKCRLCSSNDLILYYAQGNYNQFRFYKCSNCKLVNYDLIGGLNQNKYSDNMYIDPNDNSKKMNIDQKNAYTFIKKNIKNRGKFLDIGCGNGKLLLEAKSDGWEVKGLELSEYLAVSIKQKFGIDVEVSNFLEYEPQNNEVFDIIVLRHVLEHLPDSILAMKKINSLLKHKGVAILEFPDIESIEIKFKRWLNNTGIYEKKYKPSYLPGHCNEFCIESFNYLLNKTGFKLSKWEHYSSKPILNCFYKVCNFGNKVRTVIIKN